MSNPKTQTAQVAIKVDSTLISTTLMNQLSRVEVESTAYLPTMAEITFYDEELKIVDGSTFTVGVPLQIDIAAVGTDKPTPVFKGEIVALEPEFRDDFTATLTVRAYDKSHRLHRGTKSKVFVNSSDKDIAEQVGTAAKLEVEADTTSPVHEHVFQHNQTDMAFLRERAARHGFEIVVDDSTLYFRKPEGDRGEVTLTWGQNLLEFHPKLTLSGQVNQVTVKGWDPANKQAIIGQASSTTAYPEVNVGGNGASLSQQRFGDATLVEVQRPVNTQDEATKVAQAMLDIISSAFLEAEGVAYGNPALLAGKKAKIERVGTKFSGTYEISAALHTFTPSEGYRVRFSVQGHRPDLMSDLVGDQFAAARPRGTSGWGGLVPAIVTNNSMVTDYGMVKVKYPWLDDQLESFWARIIAPGAGAKRGIYWLPEVNDEVIVAFEHGDFNRPYVIGGVWNGQDAPPEAKDVVVADGKVKTRVLKTRDGSLIRFTDAPDAPMIEIQDGKTGVILKLEGKAGSEKLTITCKGDIEVTANKNITVKADENMTLEAGKNMTIKAGGNIDITSTGNTAIQADKNIDIQAKGTGSLQATQDLTIKGSLVQIN